jgi:hypothetical protein
MKELWTYLDSAQNTEGGVPKEFLEIERELQLKSQNEQNKIRDEIMKRTIASHLPRQATNTSRGEYESQDKGRNYSRDDRGRGSSPHARHNRTPRSRSPRRHSPYRRHIPLHRPLLILVVGITHLQKKNENQTVKMKESKREMN